MDWIDPRYAAVTDTISDRQKKSGRAGRQKGLNPKRSKPLTSQVSAALAQPVEVWAEAFDHALSKLKWPSGVGVETTFLWSTLMQEQAEVLVRAGMSAKKLSAIISERTATTPEAKAAQLSEVVGLMDQSLESLAFQWLDTADIYPHSALAIAALAWHIPEHAKRPGNEWLTQWMQALMDRMSGYKADPEEAVICHLVLECELPLLIGLATAASKRTVLAEASKSMDSLAEHLERSEDNTAPWLMHGATYLRAGLASVLRCRTLANSFGLRKLYPPQQKALAGLLRHAARWSRPDGTQLLAAPSNAPRSKAIWEALVAQTKRPKSMLAAMALSGIGEGKRSAFRKKAKEVTLPAFTHYSAGASGACMQTHWLQKGSRIAVDFSDTNICLEALGSKGSSVLVGEWTAAVERDGQAQLQLDEWQEVCWFSDDDADYLELQAQFGSSAKVQRQIMLFREEKMLLLADALLCDEAGGWSIRAEIPLPADARFEPEKKTTEGIIATDSGRSLALPLFLPEWRRQLSTSGSADSLTVEKENLVVRAETKSNRLYAATLISLCGSHAKQDYTWRNLTVGEDLRVVGADEAVAYRIQIGTEQWIVYRSLAPPIRRTALGMHTLADFFVGRFDADEGEIDEILEVEPAAQE